MQIVLQDTQTRLFFKAQSVIQSEILYYMPTTHDLAYISLFVSIVALFSRSFSETGIAALGAPTKNEFCEKQSFTRLLEGAGLHQRETWFLTLSKTVWVFSQLYDFVQVRFLEFSCNLPPVLSAGYNQSSSTTSQAVRLCCWTLQMRWAKSAFDGQLFLVHHLLILRDIARNVDLTQKDEPRERKADA